MLLIGVASGLCINMTAQPVIQTSFNAGEWAPALISRVDLAKYHSGAALLRNFFVDYRGGASTRSGTQYVLTCLDSGTESRLIGFQASFAVSYILEFGNRTLRFYNNGVPVFKNSFAITGITNANPGVVHIPGHTINVSDVIRITSVVGMFQVNNEYFFVSAVSANFVTLADLTGTPLNTSAYGAYTSGGTASVVYAITSPYLANDLINLKFAQNVNTLIITHPDYVPYVLTLIGSNNWTLLPAQFGSTVVAPTGVAVATTLAAGNVNYSYIVTALDNHNQESSIGTPGALANKTDLRSVAGTNSITWNAVSGANSYNVYKAEPSYAGAVASGAAYGFIGNCTGTNFADSNIDPDYSQTPPIVENPFQGAGVESVLVTAPGAYTTAPLVTFAAAPTGGQTATGTAVLVIQSVALVAPHFGGAGFAVGESVFFGSTNVVLIVATIGGGGAITAFQPLTYPGTNLGNATGTVIANPITSSPPSGGGTSCSVDFTWGVGYISINSPGSGYISAPAITFSAGAAAATATLGQASAGNPSAVTYFQQRLVLAAQTLAPQSFNMSQPGNYFNFNIRNPIQPDDAIAGSLVSGQLNTIQSMVAMPSGLIVLSDKAAWQLDGGANGSPVTPISITANSHSYNGASGVPPIVANFDILYVQAKGSIVRDLTYNLYANIFTGSDITVFSSHLFYGYQIREWAWAEEPFKVVWCVRDDGTLLSLTFLKEQELIAWAHSDTHGAFKSIATVTEQVSFGAVDAVYVIVERVINGRTVKYIERMVERIFPNGVEDAWCVDAGLQYDGSPATVFSGALHLAGATVTGLADGVVIPPFVMPASGSFTLPAASKVTIGLAYTCQLQTLAIDLGEPTAQGKRKQITGVTVRVENTLDLKIGRTFDSLVAMKDLVVGNVGSASNEVVTNLVTGDARTIIDSAWTVPGQYCIEQSVPKPATVLGVIPEIIVGDTKGDSK